MIIFSQIIHKHSRIGNSLLWMARASLFLESNNIKGNFPYAHESFNSYLRPGGAWLNTQNNEEARRKYLYYFNEELSQRSVATKSRLLQVKFEQDNCLKPFEWKNIVYWVLESKVLFISGDVNFSDDNLLKKIKEAELVIIHEPYPFNCAQVDEDLDSILPNIELYEQQRAYVLDISGGKTRIGYHIRRGDYAEWAGGKYFYSDEYWVDLISEHAQLREVKVWLFSNDNNERIIKSLLEKGNIDFEVSGGDFYQDFVRLMSMDTIYGPPSTFTGLSASLGRLFEGNQISLNFLD